MPKFMEGVMRMRGLPTMSLLPLLGFLLLVLSSFSGGSSGHESCRVSGDGAHNHPSHDHHHDHDHVHHDHDVHHHPSREFKRIEKLPEELTEDEDDEMEQRGAGSRHSQRQQPLSGLRLWLSSLSCSLLVSLASLICLLLLPILFVNGKPSKSVVDSLALFGAGAMLGDAFLHQLPHAFSKGHSHAHEHHHAEPHAFDHSHSLEDLSVGLSILSGIVVFLMVEKAVRFVEENSSGSDSRSHGHHHHHHNTHQNQKSSDSTNQDDALQRKSQVPSSNMVLGYLNLFSDGVHNFTDGMALGSAFLAHGVVGGWSRTLFLLAHELPQEIGDFGVLVRSGFSVPQALLFNFLSALVAVAGTAMALVWGRSTGQSSLIEGFTAGGFVYISVGGVLAGINSGGGETTLKRSAGDVFSVVLGMLVALSISLFE